MLLASPLGGLVFTFPQELSDSSEFIKFILVACNRMIFSLNLLLNGPLSVLCQ